MSGSGALLKWLTTALGALAGFWYVINADHPAVKECKTAVKEASPVIDWSCLGKPYVPVLASWTVPILIAAGVGLLIGFVVVKVSQAFRA
jgi:hypothetical protein